MIGREEERAVLGEALAGARDGRTQIVSLIGPAGIGKTRLIHDFVDRHQGSSAEAVLVFRGSPRDTATSYGLFTRLLRARFGLVEGMAPDDARQQIRTQASRVLEDRKVGDVIYFLGQLLDLPFSESPLTKAVRDDPHQAELLRRAVFKSFLEADAQSAPMVLVFDDLQQAHEDSLSLLRYLLEYLNGKVLVICAARADLLVRYEDWDRVGEDRHRLIDLVALDDDDASTVMRALLAPSQDPVEPLVEAAVSFAGGNPAMLEQMVRIFHDAGVLREERAGAAHHAVWRVDLPRLAGAKLPLTIEDAVTARIAALDPEERRLLENASIMGSVFWRGGFLAMARAEGEGPEYWNPEADDDGARIDALL
ncbi:MAG: AAA family ATPase, partial [Myxococcota bacterium]